MSKIRNKLIATLTIFAMLFTSLSAVMFASNNFVKAEGEESTPVVESVFELQDGASAGYIDEEEKNFAGLRWETKINKAYYDSLTANGETLEFGTLIAPASYVTIEGELKIETLVLNDDFKDENGDYYLDAEKTKYVSNIVNANATSILFDFGDDASGEYVMRSAIRYDELDENLIAQAKTELVARAYVKILDAEGKVIDVKYSDADTVRSLRNSVAYNLAAGNFSEEDAAELKKFAVDGDIIDCGEQYAFYNIETNTAKFTELAGASNVEFILDSKPVNLSVDANGVVTFGKMDANDKVLYLSAFANGNLYYKKLTVAKAISTAEEFSETFSLAIGDLTVANNYDDIAVFDGVYVLTNNIDFAGKTMSTDYINVALHGNNAVHNDSATNGIIMQTKALKTGSVFDGQGYTVKNITVGQSGLFGSISGTVKNVAFVNAKISSGAGGFLAQRIYLSALIQNVYLDVTASDYALTYAMTTGTNLDTVYVKTNASLMYAESNYATSGGMTITANMFGRFTKLLYVSKTLIANQGNYRVGFLKNEYTLPYVGNKVMNIPGYEEVTENVFTPGNGGKIRITSGDIHRFEDETLLTKKYIEDETAKEFLNSFSNDYFVVNNDGRIFWKTDYRLTANDEAITGEGLTLEYGDTVEIDLVDYLGNVSANFVIEDDSDVISLENNIIKADNVGTYDVKIYVNDILLEVFKVTVVKKTIDKTSEAVIVDANGEAFTAPEGYLETSVNVDGVTVDYNNGVLKLLGAEVTTDSNGVVTPTEYIVTFETATSAYKYKVKYITAYIKDADDFVSIFALAKGDLTTAESTEELATFDGYYMLANNIDFAGMTMPTETYTYTGRTYYSDGVMNIGLTGTFDGDGYAIYNLSAPRGGIFGAISGTLQNVAFINCNINSTEKVHTGFLANMIYSSSKINNIYVSLNDTYSMYKHIASTYMTYSACFVGCYFEADLSFLLSPITTTNEYRAGAIDNVNYATILVSRQMMGSRNEYGTANGIEANADGTTPNRPYYGDKYAPDGDLDGTGANEHPRKNRILNGAFYRYEDREDLLVRYNGTDTTDAKAATRAANVKALFAKFDTNLFDVGEGRIAWKNDLTAYSILYNNNKVVDDIISVPSDGDKEITLSVKNGIDVVLENEDLTYVLDCKDGSVTLTGAVLTINKDGEATVTIKMGDKVIRVVTIDVYKPIIDKTNDPRIILDSFGEEIAGIDAVYSASVEGGEATVVDGNKVALSFENEAEAADKDYVVSIETETNTILYKARYYTSYIKTPEEFVKTFSLGSDDNVAETISDLDKLPSFSGHYVLANNIDLAGEEMPTDTYIFDFAQHYNVKANYAIAKTKGLTGTFNGNGYTIYNLNVPTGGLFGIINGKILNVAFINIDLAQGATGGMLGALLTDIGLLSNVYIDYSVGYKGSAYVIANYAPYNTHGSIVNSYISANISLFRDVIYLPGEKTSATHYTTSKFTSSTLIYISKQSPVYGDGYRVDEAKGVYAAYVTNPVNKPLRGNSLPAAKGGHLRFGSDKTLRFNSVNTEGDAFSLLNSYATYESIIDTYDNDYIDVVVTKDGDIITNVTIEWAKKNAQ